MKDVLVQLARYNAAANEALLAILAKLPYSLAQADLKVYYKSILGTFQHIVMAELSWLKRFDGFFPGPLLGSNPLLAREAAALKQESGASLAACAALCAEVDELFVAFAEGLDESKLGERVRYRNMKGEELERLYWQTIVHVLNHGTHHRGEISALLDQNGIANDVSGFTLYAK